MTETHFVVERTPTGEQAVLYYDCLPPRLSDKNAQRNGLIYRVRVDTLPQAARWLKMSLAELYQAYCSARDGNTLPKDPIAVSVKEQTSLRFGERHARRPSINLPDTCPTVDEINQRAENRAK